jgi:hypothetical protein
MRRVELTALRSTGWTWEAIAEALEPALDGIGLSPGGSDVSVDILDRGAHGRVLVFDHGALARRAALALAKRTGSPVSIFEVVATGGGKQFNFRTAAWLATASGELKTAEGKELDLESDGEWVGSLEDQAQQVLDAFASFEYGPARSERRSFKKRKAGKPSSPRVAALLASLQKAKSHEGVPQPDGRVELRIELAAGGKQRSFCSVAEYEELQALLGA